MAENTNGAQSAQKQQLFTELFRPQTLDQAVIVPRIREELSKGLVDNILLCGTQGAGKTTLSRIMAKFGSEPIFINASMERGIDTIRERVINYGSSSSLFDGEEHMKVVVLEECDNLTNDAWMSLRATMEQFHRNVRFVANCNYIDKVPEPIQSRFNIIHIDPLNQTEEEYLINGYIERVKLILNACKITYTDEIVENFVRNDFPDMRSLIKKIQQLHTRGIQKMTADSLGATFDCSELFNIIMSAPNPIENYKAVVGNWATKADDAMLMIGQQFPKYLMSVAPDKVNRLPLVVLALAEYDAQLPNAIDKLIVLLATLFKLQQIMNG